MPTPVENQPWYPRWRAAVDHMLRVKEKRDSEKSDTAAWLLAEADYQAARAAYLLIANGIPES